jgi:glutaredoxin
MNSGTNAEVRVYWRPGCPYCSRLRADLARIGLPTREINIWADPDAAAVVRSVANGNETVPTVLVGTGDDPGAAAMVNPSAAQVLQAVRTRAPGLLDGIDHQAADRAGRGRWWSGALLALLVAVVWFGLATTHPATTYHVAPLLVAAAWPLGRRWRAGSALPLTGALVPVAGGALVALATTLVLTVRHALVGPTLLGPGSALAETLIATVVGAGLGLLAGTRGRRTSASNEGRQSTADNE